MNFYETFLKTSPMFRSTAIVSSLDYLEPHMRTALQNLLEDAAAQGHPLLVFETYRSQERQEQLFAHGATQLKTVGCHHYGIAADIVKNVGGQPSWKGDFSFMLPLARKHGLISGIDWGQPHNGHHPGFVDSGHLQRIAVRDQGQLFAGTFYPDEIYDPYKFITSPDRRIA